MKTVNIILCTYNGEKYLPELLDSLLAQTYQNIRIYIRDDGSSDRTVEIVDEYQKKSDKINVIKDNQGNLGYIKNFSETIRKSGEADYYAFCDQDDYWLPDKMANAVEKMEQCSPDQCGLYSCAYEVRNSKLEYVSEGHKPTPFSELDVGKSLSLYDGGWLLGFTLVINNTLMHKAFDKQFDVIYSHDIWVQAVTVGFGGEFIYDDRIGAYFRRHEDTTSIAEGKVNSNMIELWKYRLNEFREGKMFRKIRNSYYNYSKNYIGEVTGKTDRLFLRTYGREGNRFKKAVYPHRLKKELLAEIAWRFAALMGKV